MNSLKSSKRGGRDLLKHSATLEVTVCKKLLHNKFLKSLKKIPVSISTQEFISNNRLTESVQFILNEREVAYQADSEYISGLTVDTIKQWHFTTKETAMGTHINACPV